MAGVALLLLCRVATRAADFYLIPRELAREFDTDGILAYCRGKIGPATYEGVLRGPHGALWAGQANAWDRVLLAAAALEAEGVEALVVPGEPPRLAYRQQGWHIVRLDADEAPATQADRPEGGLAPSTLAEKHSELFHEVLPAFVLEGDAGTPQRVESRAPERVAEWAREPVTVAVPAGGPPRYVLRVGGREVLSSGPLEKVERASLELTWRFGTHKTTWARELFDRANAAQEIPGNDEPRPGDRYALVMAGGPFVPGVLRTRDFMLGSGLDTPVADPVVRDLVLLATTFFVRSDHHCALAAKEMGVRVEHASPRLVIAACERFPADKPDDTAAAVLSLDVVTNRVEAVGDKARRFHVARGLAGDLTETRLIYEAARRPVISTSAVFGKYAADTLDCPERRIEALAAEARRLLGEAEAGTRVELRALPPRFMAATSGKDDGPAPLAMVVTPQGLVLHGARRGGDAKGRAAPDGLALSPDGRIEFRRDTDALAVAVETVLRRCVADRPDFMLGCREVRPRPLEPVALVPGSVLVYRAAHQGKACRLAVLVSASDGSLGGQWVDLDSGRRGEVNGSWPDVLGSDREGPTIGVFLAAADVAQAGEATRATVRVGANEVEARALRVAAPGGARAVVLPLGDRSLVLSWERGDSSLALESASPVVRGRVLNATTKLPVPGAAVTRLDGRGSTATAGDGSFVLPVSPPLFHRLLLVIDRSGSMAFGLDPKEGKPAPPGQQRMDALRKAVHELLDRVPRGVEVALWSYSTPRRYYGGFDSPREARVDCAFTHQLDTVRQAVDQLGPEHGTPLTGAVRAVLQHVEKEPLSRDAVVVLLADGQNSCTRKSAAEAFREARGQVAIHTIGFAIEPGGKAERELRELAEASGGTYRAAATGEQLALAFREAGQEPGDVKLRASARRHSSADLTLRKTEVGQTPVELLLAGRGTPGILTIRAGNRADLRHCQDLSPKARRMVEERVADGTWCVSIPTSRVNIGDVTAYAWFETEEATGRMLGRTEDGLHGVTADPHTWPPFKKIYGDQRFVAWVTGVSAYTGASARAAMTWHREPGFLGGSATDLKEFIQANALDFTEQWWSDVGSEAHGEAPDAFWSGVCFNFGLQAAAMGLPDCDKCYRAWIRDLCRRYRQKIIDAPKEKLGEAAEEAIKKNLQGEWETLLQAVRERGLSSKFAKDIEDAWGEIVKQAIPCEKLIP
ncbi:MAG TPA: VWA domain-containing protein [Planctomycetota bacterium]|nr:VWA domain-containing protein [Planctomycetota bacterium]